MLAQFNLEAAHPDNVHIIRLPSDIASPSGVPRYRADSEVKWRDTDLKHHGQHTVDELNYIMEPKPEKGLFVYFHSEEPTTEPPRGYPDLDNKSTLEQDAEPVCRSEIDCEEPWRSNPIREWASTWWSAVVAAAKDCRYIGMHNLEDITRATGLAEEGGLKKARASRSQCLYKTPWQT